MDGIYQNSSNTGLKRIDYEYDLVSGKVNFVRYQDGQPDAFYYAYNYDADNRLTKAWSSTTAMVDTATGSYLPKTTAKQDAAYYYYLHGPLRRMELGDSTKVQGVDYAYTLQGWLKGVNSTSGTAALDMGQDGTTVARDAYGYSLGYYTNDYNPIGGSSYAAFALKYTAATGDITGQSLYNGNISNATLAINQLGSPVGYTYHYDQLNRLKKTRQHTGIGGTSWDRGSITLNYQENATYDGNGNILTYGRNGAAPTAQTIDSLTYNYNRTGGRLTNNRLQNINDAVASSNYSGDLTNQSNTSNYRYDATGNLIYDYQSGIRGNDGTNSITWSVYGKIQGIYKTTGTISYTYDASGQRVSKTANGLTTYYIRDAQGNTLAIYDNANSTINWKEQQLYGSSRLGLWAPNENLATNNATAIWDTTGSKQYELTNHLGNVLETITDKRLQHTTDNTNIDYYLADISTAQDYYPFGMLMPGRQYSFFNVYRYGFNGKENDNDVKGTGNQQDYGERVSDPRVGRFPSVDPLSRNYPELTPYQFASNTPIQAIDLDGLEAVGFNAWNMAMSNQRDAALKKGDINTAENVKGRMDNAAMSGIITTDAILFKGRGMQILTALLFTSALHDNIAKTQKGRDEQNKQSWTSIANAGLLWGSSEVLGKTFSLVGDVANLAGRRFNLAIEWMGSAEKAQYVDISQPVYTKPLEVGTKLVQFRVTGQEGFVGNFYATPGTTPEQIGLDPKDVSQTFNITVDKKTTVLISTHIKNATYYANPDITVEGGGQQIFSPDLKKNITIDSKTSNGNN